MLIPKLVAKITVLCLFILLITSFVAYRSGAFNIIFNKTKRSPNAFAGISMISGDQDTLPKKDSSSHQPPTYFSSSKVMIMTEQSLLFENKELKKILRKDSLRNLSEIKKLLNPDTLIFNKKNNPQKIIMMSGSKSGAILNTSDIIFKTSDIKLDTTKKHN